MSTTRSKLKHLAAAGSAIAIISGGAVGNAGAQDIQPAASGCVIQGSGTPCTLNQAGTSESAAEQSAIAWAQAQAGSTQWDGYCLEFVYQAYLQAGVDITAQAGSHDSAISFWNTYNGTKNPPSESPPAGALVVWDATASNPAGHIAISEGNGMAISSDERSYPGVHELTIANRDNQGYVQVGWVMPG